MRSQLTITGSLALAALLISGCERPPVESTQVGYRGTGMVDVQNPRDPKEAMAYPDATPLASSRGPRAGDVYQNVQVLGDLSVAEFTRLMTAITEWVSPEQGCNYCHNPQNLASDDLYTKVVSRRMIQMTQYVNEDWDDNHVKSTGVNCYTCHRGKNVPEYIWFTSTGEQSDMAANAGNLMGQNQASQATGYTSLPVDPYTTYLTSPDNPRARIIPEAMFPSEDYYATIQQTESVYGLMFHLSSSLDVNCTYCHQTASFQSWDISNPARRNAYFGIEMVRALNADYLTPLQPVYPDYRLGELGDAPKAYCATCHQGQKKPLNGAPAIDMYPSLAGD